MKCSKELQNNVFSRHYILICTSAFLLRTINEMNINIINDLEKWQWSRNMTMNKDKILKIRATYPILS